MVSSSTIMRNLWVSGFFLFFTFATTNLTFGCFKHEKGALLRFKRSLESDTSGRLSSWKGNNCCHWKGVLCDNATGHVTTLDLGTDYPFWNIKGNELNPSLAKLSRLSYMDLSGTYFGRGLIPEFIGTLTQLRFLNLSSMAFSGIVPHFIGNLSNLRVLDISNMKLVVDDFTWFTNLLSLNHLDLSGLSIVNTPNFEKTLLYMISSLRVLRLSSCDLSNSHFRRMHLESNLTLSTIQTLDLSSNSIQGEFPLFLQNLTSLRVLDLSSNSVNSTIPFMNSLLDLNLNSNRFQRIQDTGVWRLCRLKRLDLSINYMVGGFMLPSTNVSDCAQFDLETLNLNYNELGGEIPASLGRLTTLRQLYLQGNEFRGTLPESLGNLTSLQELDLSMNRLRGSIPFSLGRLSNLAILSLRYNCFSGLPLSMGNLSELQSLDIYSNCLQGPLPTIGQLSKLRYLDISSNSLSGVVTEAHFANTSMLKYFDATSNYMLRFKISPDWKPPFQIENLQLRSCKIESEFPRWVRTQKRLGTLILYNTSIFGPLPDWLGELPIWVLDISHNFLNGPLKNLPSNQTSLPIPGSFSVPTYSLLSYQDSHSRLLRLKNNLFNGPIPDSLCNVTYLGVLDLSRNMLSGTLPECFGNLRKMYVLILSSNRLSGVIPSSLGNLGHKLLWLSLNNNSFHGELPKTLANCSNLSLLDLGENQFFGSLPKWIGENITSLNILRLHKNSFTGPIPLEWSKNSEMQIMDLGENKLTGTIPRSFQNFSGMKGDYHIFQFPVKFEQSLSQIMKGVVLEYTTTLRYVVNMDLSSNKLVGEIPKELVLLSGLLGLNLSNNHLTGRIPNKIGDMNSLIYLDLSINGLSGMIPQSMSALTFLSHLNLSHNDLSGRIPTGRQLQTLIDPSIYAGNRELCGSPLPIKCKGEYIPETGRTVVEDGQDDDVEKIWIYGVTSGFATGFMVIVGILVLKNRWRIAFFNFVGYYIGKKL